MAGSFSRPGTVPTTAFRTLLLLALVSCPTCHAATCTLDLLTENLVITPGQLFQVSLVIRCTSQGPGVAGAGSGFVGTGPQNYIVAEDHGTLNPTRGDNVRQDWSWGGIRLRGYAQGASVSAVPVTFAVWMDDGSTVSTSALVTVANHETPQWTILQKTFACAEEALELSNIRVLKQADAVLATLATADRQLTQRLAPTLRLESVLVRGPYDATFSSLPVQLGRHKLGMRVSPSMYAIVLEGLLQPCDAGSDILISLRIEDPLQLFLYETRWLAATVGDRPPGAPRRPSRQQQSPGDSRQDAADGSVHAAWESATHVLMIVSAILLLLLVWVAWHHHPSCRNANGERRSLLQMQQQSMSRRERERNGA